jgi:hypothetical protein
LTWVAFHVEDEVVDIAARGNSDDKEGGDVARKGVRFKSKMLECASLL